MSWWFRVQPPPLSPVAIFVNLTLTFISFFRFNDMGAFYDEIEIEDMAWDEAKRVYHYPCPCGDRFEISRQQLADCEDVATCPSCSLIIRVIFDPVCFYV